MSERKTLRRQNIATLLALAIGFGIVIPVYTIYGSVTGLSVMEGEAAIIFIHAAMAAMPFLILTGKNLYDRITWIVGIALTIPVWCLYLYSGIRYHLSGDTSGVGGEAAILLVWPFLVSFLCVRLARRRSR